MSTRKLLISAATAALMAGSAAALGVTQGDVGADPLAGAAPQFVAAGLVAEEASFAVADSENGVFELTITSTGTFAANENYFFDVSVSGGTFFQDLTGAEVTSGTVSVTGSSVQIAGQTETGQEGESSVRFLVSTGPAAANTIGLELPVAFSGCPGSLNFSVGIQTSGGVTFEEGTVSLATPALTCINAYQGTITTDVVAGANDSVLASTTFTNWLAGVTTSGTDENADGTLEAAVPDTGTVATLGVVELEWNPDGVPGTVYSSLNPTVTVSGLAAEVDSVDFDVVLEDDTGVEDASMRTGGDTDTFVAEEASLSASVDDDITTDEFIDNITVTVNTVPATAVQVAQQSVTTTNGIVDFGAATLVASEPVADATLDDMNYEGETCGTYDWVGDATKPTANIFRATGFGATTTAIVATLTNSSDGVNGSMTLPGPFDFTAPEIILNSATLTDAFGNFGRADVLFNFIGASTALDCDRLMNSDAANIITPFGNKQSSTFGTDGDDD